MNQEYLYKVKYKRTSYDGSSSIEEETELFATDKKSINTYRMGGFQRDSIEILSAKRLRKRRPIELNADIERNELSFIVDIHAHIESTLNRDEKLENALDKLHDDRGEALEQLGYELAVHDNSYNWCSDFSNDIDFKVYLPKGSNADWIYSDDAVVLIDLHHGLDARAGYSPYGVFRPFSYDGLAHFLEAHVRLSIIDENNKVIDDYDGDCPFNSIEKDGYRLTRVIDEQIPVLTKEGREYQISYYHPCEGI